jgi:hypothetical protein
MNQSIKNILDFVEQLFDEDFFRIWLLDDL